MMASDPTSRRSARTLRVLLALGLGLNLGLLYLYYTPAPKALMGDEFYYTVVASRIATGRPVEPSPIWPPLYADLLAEVFRLFGLSRLPMQLIQIVMWLVAGLLVHRIAARLAAAPMVASVAAGLFLLSPELMAFSHYFWAETAHLFFCVAALWFMVCHARTLLAVAASGVLLGLALLTKLLLLPITPLVPVAFALCTTMPWRARLGRALLLGAMIALTVTPTMLGNRERFGKLMIADSSTLNLWLGLNPPPNHGHQRALEEFMAAGPDMDTRNAVYREKTRRYVQSIGLVETLRRQLARQYFKLFSYQTWFMIQLPGGYMTSRYQFASPALALALRAWSHVAHALLLATMALGVAALRPRPRGWWTVLLGFLLYNLALYLPTNTNARYFLQMMPAAMLFAGVGACWIAGLARGTVSPPAPCFAFTRPRLVLGGALVVLVEYLAFQSFPALGM